MISRLRSLSLLSFFLLVGAVHAEKAIPFLSSPVIDDLGLLTANEKQQIIDLAQSQKHLIQMQLWITSLEGESIEGLSIRAATKWALGTEKRDNGILFLVAPNEKRMRIEVGRGLEGDIPDILAGRILDLMVRPQFREGHFYDGIRSGMDELIVLANKGPEAEKAKKELSAEPQGKSKDSPFFVFAIFGLIMLFNFISRIFGRRRYGSGFSYWGGGGGWGGGSGGGSSWSGGGGSFGGGGSSSSW